MIALTLYHVELSTFRAIVCKWETEIIHVRMDVALLAVQCLAWHTHAVVIPHPHGKLHNTTTN